MMAIVLLPKIDFSCRFVIYKLFIYMCVCTTQSFKVKGLPQVGC